MRPSCVFLSGRGCDDSLPSLMASGRTTATRGPQHLGLLQFPQVESLCLSSREMLRAKASDVLFMQPLHQTLEALLQEPRQLLVRQICASFVANFRHGHQGFSPNFFERLEESQKAKKEKIPTRPASAPPEKKTRAAASEAAFLVGRAPPSCGPVGFLMLHASGTTAYFQLQSAREHHFATKWCSACHSYMHKPIS